MAAAGRGSSYVAALPGYGTAGRAATDASGVAAPGENREITATAESDGEVSEKSLETG